jgi:hypothetical protein
MDVNQTFIRRHSYGRNHNRRPVDSTLGGHHPDAVPT